MTRHEVALGNFSQCRRIMVALMHMMRTGIHVRTSLIERVDVLVHTFLQHRLPERLIHSKQEACIRM